MNSQITAEKAFENSAFRLKIAIARELSYLEKNKTLLKDSGKLFDYQTLLYSFKKKIETHE